MFEHTYASRVWVAVNVSTSGELQVVLMIETKIPLDPHNSRFDDESYNSLTAATAAYIASSEHFDRAMIVPFNESSGAERIGQGCHHLAGWRFSVEESHLDERGVSVIDVHHPDFHEALEWAMRQFSPGSVLMGHFPLSEEMLQNGHSQGVSEKGIPLRGTPVKPNIAPTRAGILDPMRSAR